MSVITAPAPVATVSADPVVVVLDPADFFGMPVYEGPASLAHERLMPGTYNASAATENEDEEPLDGVLTVTAYPASAFSVTSDAVIERLRAENDRLAKRVHVLEARREAVLKRLDGVVESNWKTNPAVQLAEHVALTLLGRRGNWRRGDRAEGYHTD